jgi:prefoldin subunit 5
MSLEFADINRLKSRVETLETFKAEAQHQLAEQQETIYQLRAGLAAHAEETARNLYGNSA